MSSRLAATLISGALVGKVLGFLREIAMARLVGANLVADGFRGALTAVLLPVAPLQSDSLPAVLIPLHRQWSLDGDAPQRSGALAVLVTGFALLVACAVFLFAAPWIGVLVGQFDGDAQRLTVQFVQVMCLAIPASVLSAYLGSIEIALGRSRIAALRAATQNLGMMVGIAVMALSGHAVAIAWGFVLSFDLVLIYALLTMVRLRAITLRGVDLGMLRDVGAIFWRRFRAMLGIPVAEQVNVLLERMLASGVAVGALASLDYARTLTETTFYLVSQPIGYVVLTRASSPLQDTRSEVQRICTRLLALGAPVSVFVVLFASDIVTIVFARGAFDAHAVGLTAGAMRGIGAGLWASMLGWVLVRMLNAAGRHGVAAGIVASAFAVNGLFNLLVVTRLGTLGLGLGEAARGLMLLGGTAVALDCGPLVLRCVTLAGGIALPLAIAGICIGASIDGPLPRLMVAVPVFATVTGTWLAAVLPDQRRWALGLLRRPQLARRF